MYFLTFFLIELEMVNKNRSVSLKNTFNSLFGCFFSFLFSYVTKYVITSVYISRQMTMSSKWLQMREAHNKSISVVLFFLLVCEMIDPDVLA